MGKIREILDNPDAVNDPPRPFFEQTVAQCDYMFKKRPRRIIHRIWIVQYLAYLTHSYFSVVSVVDGAEAASLSAEATPSVKDSEPASAEAESSPADSSMEGPESSIP